MFYITCFVPFVRPDMPNIRDASLVQARQAQKDNIKRRKQAQVYSKEEEELDIY